MSDTANDGSAPAYRATALALMILAVAGHAIYLRQSSAPDLEMFVYMGKLTATGGRVGVDLIDNKFPTVGLIMSVPYRLLGANWRGYGLLGLAATIGAAFVLAHGATRHFGAKCYWPTLTAAMVWGNFLLCIFSPFQLEHLQYPLCALAGVAALNALREKDRRDAFAVGLCAGLAAWCKPNALAVVGAFGLVVAHRRDWKLLIATMIGLALPTLTAVVCLHASGTLAMLPDIARQIGRYSGHSAWNASEIASKLLDLLILFGLPFVTLLPLPFVLTWERAGERVLAHDVSKTAHGFIAKRPLPNPLPCEYKWEREALFLVLWLGLEFLGGLLQGRLFPYSFLPMAAPAALLFGSFNKPQRALSLLAGFGPPLAIACIGAVILLANTGGATDRQRVIDFLAARTLAGGSAWMDEYPRLAVESDWTPASRMPLINLLTNDDDAPRHFGDMLISDLAARRPEFLALRSDEAKFIHYFTVTQQDVRASPIRQQRMADALRQLYRFAAEHYRPATTIGAYTVWSRVDDASIVASIAEKP